MNPFRRISNLWKLSAFEPGKPTDEYKTPGTEVSSLIKKPQKASFVAFNRRDPVAEIVNQDPNGN